MKMESKKRKPLADITNTFNTRPVAAPRNISGASSGRNSRSNLSSVPISKSQKPPCSDSSNRSVASVGSSSIDGSARASGNVRRRNPTRIAASANILGGSRNRDVAANAKQAAEKDKKEQKADVPIDSLSHVEKRTDKGKAIVPSFSSWLPKMKADFLVSSSTPVEKRKDKGKAVAEPFSSSVPGKKADTVDADPTLSEKRIDKGKAVAVPFDSLVAEGEGDVLILDPTSAEMRQDKGKAVVGDSSVPGKNANDLSFYQTPVDKRKDKGKAVDVPFSLPLENKDKGKAVAGSSMLEVTEDDQNGMHSRYSPPPMEKLQLHQLGLWPVGGDYVATIEDLSSDDLQIYNVSRKKAKIGTSVISSGSSSMGTQEVTEESERTDRPSASSVVKENELQKEIILPPIEKEREKEKRLILANSLKKARNKEGKESSATGTVSTRPQRVKAKGGKTGAGPSSCPPPRKTKNIQNDLDDEAGNDESSKSLTDPRPRPRKKRRTWSGSTDEEYQKFFKQHEDYFKKQQAYFKEIDDFELMVEEASSEESG